MLLRAVIEFIFFVDTAKCNYISQWIHFLFIYKQRFYIFKEIIFLLTQKLKISYLHLYDMNMSGTDKIE